jgi:hypothetical protein
MRKSGSIRLLCLLPVLVIVAACGRAPQQQSGTPLPEGLILWDRSPSSIVFRADVIGGPEDISRLSEIPLCTIYGDNRIVWVNELDAFHVEVLYDTVRDSAISDFVSYLTVQERIYTFQALADLQESGEIAPVVESVTLNVNGQPHTADAFSGWDSDWFSRVVRSCQRIGQAPILYEPSGGWVTVQRSEYNMQAPNVNWDATGSSLSFAEIADSSQPRWIDGTDVVTLWNSLHSLPSSLRFLQDDLYYRVGLQLPGITRTSPPAP